MADKFLSQDEVDALLKGVDGDQDDVKPAGNAGDVRDYNLATQERIVRGRMPTLEIINERFSRLVRIELFNFLRRTVEVSVGPVRITKYSDFVRNLVVPTNLNLVQVKPLRGTALMVFDPICLEVMAAFIRVLKAVILLKLNNGLFNVFLILYLIPIQNHGSQSTLCSLNMCVLR